MVQGAGVAWAGCRAVPAALAQLATDCAALSRECRVPGDGRGMFTPHCTLRRKVRQAPGVHDLAALHWTPDAFHLLESAQQSGGGVRYQSLGRFPLLSANT
ncbi:MAG: hypothetical protein R3E95_23575 [Thiolinea sp.]